MEQKIGRNQYQLMIDEMEVCADKLVELATLMPEDFEEQAQVQMDRYDELETAIEDYEQKVEDTEQIMRITEKLMKFGEICESLSGE